MTARVASQRFRQRKLSTKQNLTILREGEIEPLPDDDAARNIPKLETGVEKAEEVVSTHLRIPLLLTSSAPLSSQPDWDSVT